MRLIGILTLIIGAAIFATMTPGAIITGAFIAWIGVCALAAPRTTREVRV